MDRAPSKTKPDAIPEPALRRFPAYCHLLQTMAAEGVTHVSTTGIEGPLQLDPTQVRKHREATGIRRIEAFLGWDQTKEALPVGAGSLGTAHRYHRSRQFGIDPAKSGLSIAGIEILSLDQLVEYLPRHEHQAGCDCHLRDSAPSVADSLVEGGIRAICNFDPVYLQVPQSVLLQNEDLYRFPAPSSFRLERMSAAESDSSMMGPIAGPRPNEDSSGSVLEPTQ
jgi:redox-sensing transcriptional repressor